MKNYENNSSHKSSSIADNNSKMMIKEWREKNPTKTNKRLLL